MGQYWQALGPRTKGTDRTLQLMLRHAPRLPVSSNELILVFQRSALHSTSFSLTRCAQPRDGEHAVVNAEGTCGPRQIEQCGTLIRLSLLVAYRDTTDR